MASISSWIEEKTRKAKERADTKEVDITDDFLRRLGVIASYSPKSVVLPLLIDKVDKRRFDPSPANTIFGVVVLADISGFTKLGEALANGGGIQANAKKGGGPKSDIELAQMHRQGADALVTCINNIFSKLINIIEGHGGDILKFAGDALLCIWRTKDTQPSLEDKRKIGLMAAQATCKMQELMGSFVVEGVSLSLHSGLSAGKIVEVHMGGFHNRWEYMVAGQPLADMGEALDDSKKGEAVMHQSLWNIINDQLVTKPTVRYSDIDVNDPAALADCKTHVLLRCKADTSKPADVLNELLHFKSGRQEEAMTMLKSYIPHPILNILGSGDDAIYGELRRVTIIFINLPDFKYDSPEELTRCQQAFFAIQKIVRKYDGAIRQLIQDDKGTVCIVAYGLPYGSHEDDALRAVLTAMDVHKALREQIGMRTGIGVSTGHAYCGSVGNKQRAEYSITGACVNLSARLMGKSKMGILCEKNTVHYAMRSSPIVGFQSKGLIKVKGFSTKIPIHSPYHQKEAFSLGIPDTTLIGRAEELEAMNRLIHNFKVAGEGGVVLISAEAGMGKTRLIQEALPFLGNIAQDTIESSSCSSSMTADDDQEHGSNNNDSNSSNDDDHHDRANGVTNSHSNDTVNGDGAGAKAGKDRIFLSVGSSTSIKTPFGLWQSIMPIILAQNASNITGDAAYDALHKRAYKNITRDSDPQETKEKEGGEENGALVQELTGKILRSCGINEEEFCLLNEVLDVEFSGTHDSKQMTSEERNRKTTMIIMQLFQANRRLFGPLSIIIENLQWIDNLSWKVLTKLAHNTQVGILIITTMRPSIPKKSRLVEVIDKLKINHAIIDLQPLEKRDIESLCCLELDLSTIKPQLSQLFQEASGGNPLFVHELVNSMKEQEAKKSGNVFQNKRTSNFTMKAYPTFDDYDGIAFKGPSATAQAKTPRNEEQEISVSASIQQIMTSHIDMLTPIQQEILKKASVIGNDFRVSVLKKACATISESQLEDDLQAMQVAGILVTEGTSFEDMVGKFRHSTMQDVAYKLLSSRDRQALHLLIATSIESEQLNKEMEYLERINTKRRTEEESNDTLFKNDWANRLSVSFGFDPQSLKEPTNEPQHQDQPSQRAQEHAEAKSSSKKESVSASLTSGTLKQAEMGQEYLMGDSVFCHLDTSDLTEIAKRVGYHYGMAGMTLKSIHYYYIASCAAKTYDAHEAVECLIKLTAVFEKGSSVLPMLQFLCNPISVAKWYERLGYEYLKIQQPQKAQHSFTHGLSTMQVSLLDRCDNMGYAELTGMLAHMACKRMITCFNVPGVKKKKVRKETASLLSSLAQCAVLTDDCFIPSFMFSFSALHQARLSEDLGSIAQCLGQVVSGCLVLGLSDLLSYYYSVGDNTIDDLTKNKIAMSQRMHVQYGSLIENMALVDLAHGRLPLAQSRLKKAYAFLIAGKNHTSSDIMMNCAQSLALMTKMQGDILKSSSLFIKLLHFSMEEQAQSFITSSGIAFAENLALVGLNSKALEETSRVIGRPTSCFQNTKEEICLARAKACAAYAHMSLGDEKQAIQLAESALEDVQLREDAAFIDMTTCVTFIAHILCTLYYKREAAKMSIIGDSAAGKYVVDSTADSGEGDIDANESIYETATAAVDQLGRYAKRLSILRPMFHVWQSVINFDVRNADNYVNYERIQSAQALAEEMGLEYEIELCKVWLAEFPVIAPKIKLFCVRCCSTPGPVSEEWKDAQRAEALMALRSLGFDVGNIDPRHVHSAANEDANIDGANDGKTTKRLMKTKTFTEFDSYRKLKDTSSSAGDKSSESVRSFIRVQTHLSKQFDDLLEMRLSQSSDDTHEDKKKSTHMDIAVLAPLAEVPETTDTEHGRHAQNTVDVSGGEPTANALSGSSTNGESSPAESKWTLMSPMASKCSLMSRYKYNIEEDGQSLKDVLPFSFDSATSTTSQPSSSSALTAIGPTSDTKLRLTDKDLDRLIHLQPKQMLLTLLCSSIRKATSIHQCGEFEAVLLGLSFNSYFSVPGAELGSPKHFEHFVTLVHIVLSEISDFGGHQLQLAHNHMLFLFEKGHSQPMRDLCQHVQLCAKEIRRKLDVYYVNIVNQRKEKLAAPIMTASGDGSINTPGQSNDSSARYSAKKEAYPPFDIRFSISAGTLMGVLSPGVQSSTCQYFVLGLPIEQIFLSCNRFGYAPLAGVYGEKKKKKTNSLQGFEDFEDVLVDMQAQAQARPYIQHDPSFLAATRTLDPKENIEYFGLASQLFSASQVKSRKVDFTKTLIKTMVADKEAAPNKMPSREPSSKLLSGTSTKKRPSTTLMDASQAADIDDKGLTKKVSVLSNNNIISKIGFYTEGALFRQLLQLYIPNLDVRRVLRESSDNLLIDEVDTHLISELEEEDSHYACLALNFKFSPDTDEADAFTNEQDDSRHSIFARPTLNALNINATSSSRMKASLLILAEEREEENRQKMEQLLTNLTLTVYHLRAVMAMFPNAVISLCSTGAALNAVIAIKSPEEAVRLSMQILTTFEATPMHISCGIGYGTAVVRNLDSSSIDSQYTLSDATVDANGKRPSKSKREAKRGSYLLSGNMWSIVGKAVDNAEECLAISKQLQVQQQQALRRDYTVKRDKVRESVNGLPDTVTETRHTYAEDMTPNQNRIIIDEATFAQTKTKVLVSQVKCTLMMEPLKTPSLGMPLKKVRSRKARAGLSAMLTTYKTKSQQEQKKTSQTVIKEERSIPPLVKYETFALRLIRWLDSVDHVDTYGRHKELRMLLYRIPSSSAFVSTFPSHLFPPTKTYSEAEVQVGSALEGLQEEKKETTTAQPSLISSSKVLQSEAKRKKGGQVLVVSGDHRSGAASMLTAFEGTVRKMKDRPSIHVSVGRAHESNIQWLALRVIISSVFEDFTNRVLAQHKRRKGENENENTDTGSSSVTIAQIHKQVNDEFAKIYPDLLPFVCLFDELKPKDFDTMSLQKQVPRSEAVKSGGMAAGDRMEYAQKVCRAFFSIMIQDHPSIILLHNADRLDGSSWTAVATLCQQLPRLMVVAGVRTSNAADGVSNWDTLTFYEPLLHVNHEILQLENLNEVESKRLMMSALGLVDVPPPLLKHVFDTTQGVPSAVVEMMEVLKVDGVLKDGDQEITVAGVKDMSGGMPNVGARVIGTTRAVTSLKSIIETRLAGLEASERLVLEVASVLGDTFNANVLYHVHPPSSGVITKKNDAESERDRSEGREVPGMKEPDAETVKDIKTSMDTLIKRDLFRHLDYSIGTAQSNDEQYTFSNLSIRTSVRDSMESSKRVYLYQRVAEYFEYQYNESVRKLKLTQGDIASSLLSSEGQMQISLLSDAVDESTLAHYWRLAQNPWKTMHYTIATARKSLVNSAATEAVELYKRAIQLHRMLVRSDKPSENSQYPAYRDAEKTSKNRSKHKGNSTSDTSAVSRLKSSRAINKKSKRASLCNTLFDSSPKENIPPELRVFASSIGSVDIKMDTYAESTVHRYKLATLYEELASACKALTFYHKSNDALMKVLYELDVKIPSAVLLQSMVNGDEFNEQLKLSLRKSSPALPVPTPASASASASVGGGEKKENRAPTLWSRQSNVMIATAMHQEQIHEMKGSISGDGDGADMVAVNGHRIVKAFLTLGNNCRRVGLRYLGAYAVHQAITLSLEHQLYVHYTWSCALMSFFCASLGMTSLGEKFLQRSKECVEKDASFPPSIKLMLASYNCNSMVQTSTLSSMCSYIHSCTEEITAFTGGLRAYRHLYRDMGTVLFLQGAIDRADRVLRSCLRMATTHKDIEVRLSCLHQQGFILLLKNEPEQALILLRRAHALSHELQRPSVLCHVLLSIAHQRKSFNAASHDYKSTADKFKNIIHSQRYAEEMLNTYTSRDHASGLRTWLDGITHIAVADYYMELVSHLGGIGGEVIIKNPADNKSSVLNKKHRINKDKLFASKGHAPVGTDSKTKASTDAGKEKLEKAEESKDTEDDEDYDDEDDDDDDDDDDQGAAEEDLSGLKTMHELLQKKAVANMHTIAEQLRAYCRQYKYMECVLLLVEGVLLKIDDKMHEAMKKWERAKEKAQTRGMHYHLAQAHFLLGYHSRVYEQERSKCLLKARSYYLENGFAHHVAQCNYALTQLCPIDVSYPLRVMMGSFYALSHHSVILHNLELNLSEEKAKGITAHKKRKRSTKRYSSKKNSEHMHQALSKALTGGLSE